MSWPPSRIPPRIVVTGLAHCGLSALAAMIEAGGAPCLIVPDPHLPPFTRLAGPESLPVGRTLGLWLTRSLKQLARARLTAIGCPPMAGAMASHSLRLLREEIAARDAAAGLFAPLFQFSFDAIIADPARQADRLRNLFSGPTTSDLGPPACPSFDPHAAALAIRRITTPRPRGHLYAIPHEPDAA